MTASKYAPQIDAALRMIKAKGHLVTFTRDVSQTPGAVYDPLADTFLLLEAIAALTAPKATLSGDASLGFDAVPDVTAPPATLSGAGSLGFDGASSCVAPAATIGGAASLGFDANGVAVAPHATLSGTGQLQFTATGAMTAPTPTLSGTGTVTAVVSLTQSTVVATSSTVNDWDGTTTITVTPKNEDGSNFGTSGITCAISALRGSIGSITDNGTSFTATYSAPKSESTSDTVSATFNGNALSNTAALTLVTALANFRTDFGDANISKIWFSAYNTTEASGLLQVWNDAISNGTPITFASGKRPAVTTGGDGVKTFTGDGVTNTGNTASVAALDLANAKAFLFIGKIPTSASLRFAFAVNGPGLATLKNDGANVIKFGTNASQPASTVAASSTRRGIVISINGTGSGKVASIRTMNETRVDSAADNTFSTGSNPMYVFSLGGSSFFGNGEAVLIAALAVEPTTVGQIAAVDALCTRLNATLV